LPPRGEQGQHLVARINSLPSSAFRSRRVALCDMAAKVGIALEQGLRFRSNPHHSGAPSFHPVILSIAEFWEMLNSPRGGAHPTVDLMRALLFDEPAAVWDLYAYEIRWLEDLIRVPPVLVPTLPISIHSDGSAKLHEDAGAAAVFSVGGRKLLTVRTRLRSSKNSFFPECVGCLVAIKFTPLNLKAEVVCDCRSALYVAPRPTHHLSWRRRLTSAARQALECIKAILPLRSSTLDWRWRRAHSVFTKEDTDAVLNDEADRQAKIARNLLPAPPAHGRTWKWGAERAILATVHYPSLGTSYPTPAVPRQVMGSVKNFLNRLQKVNLAKQASRLRTMGRALRYNGEHVLRVVDLLSKHASSASHASMAMALAFYLPLANRRTWNADKDPRRGACDWCASGLRQDSPHLFSCPRLMWVSSRAFLKQQVAMQDVMNHMSPFSRHDLSRVCSESGYLRDCLALHMLGRTIDLDSAPLPFRDMKTIPHAVLHLAATFAKQALSSSVSHKPNVGRGDHRRGRGCVAGAWSQFVHSFRLSIANANLMQVSSYNSAPIREVWDVLQDTSLPAPFYAVVFEGSSALPPPSSVVWYTASDYNRDSAWWALRLPELGTTLRMFEWAPLHTPGQLAVRMQWWVQAMSASADSILWAVIPADSDIVQQLHPHQVVCHVSHAFPLRLIRPLDQDCFWLGVPSASVQVRTLLVFSTSLAPAKQVAWSLVAPTLPALLQGASGSLRTSEDPRVSHVPARWWWGIDSSSRTSLSPSGPSPNVLSRRFRCSGDALCEAVCSSSLLQSTFCRYLGNLGIPPVAVTDLLARDSTSVLEGNGEPPRWIATTWESLRLLRKATNRIV
jgi:hypothetical protein